MQVIEAPASRVARGGWRLTLPSSGRSKGRFAPFGPPLMSNVRPQNTSGSPRMHSSPQYRAGSRRSMHCLSREQRAHAPEKHTHGARVECQRCHGLPVRWRAAHRRLPTDERAKASPVPRPKLSARKAPAQFMRNGSLRRTQGAKASFSRRRSACLLARSSSTLSIMQSSAPGCSSERSKSSVSRGTGLSRCTRRVASNPSIERTFQRPLRALWPAAHVER